MEEIKKLLNAIHNSGLKVAELAMEVDEELAPDVVEKEADIILEHAQQVIEYAEKLSDLAESRRRAWQESGEYLMSVGQDSAGEALAEIEAENGRAAMARYN